MRGSRMLFLVTLAFLGVPLAAPAEPTGAPFELGYDPVVSARRSPDGSIIYLRLKNRTSFSIAVFAQALEHESLARVKVCGKKYKSGGVSSGQELRVSLDNPAPPAGTRTLDVDSIGTSLPVWIGPGQEVVFGVPSTLLAGVGDVVRMEVLFSWAQLCDEYGPQPYGQLYAKLEYTAEMLRKEKARVDGGQR